MSNGGFEKDFAELAELGLSSEHVTESAPIVENRRFDGGSLMVRRIIDLDIVGDAVPPEFAGLDYRSDALRSGFLAEQPPIEDPVSGDYFQYVKISL